MKKCFKVLTLTMSMMLAAMTGAFAQEDLTRWSTKVNELGNNSFEVLFSVDIDDTWHIYDLGPYDDMGPNPTMIFFDGSQGLTLDGSVYQLNEPHKEFDEIFEMEIGYFEKTATFGQKVTLNSPDAILKGYVEWMVCNDTGCTPPLEWEFTIDLKADNEATLVAAAPAPDQGNNASEDSEQGGKSIWGLILEAILWGFAALITPCVFPMVPMTVSFFMKGSENKAKGRRNAGLYGLFIILLYTLPIAIIIIATRVIGGASVTADIFNWLSTHWLPNILFFLVFMVFAASFFGAFEITMPSKLVNKTDKKSDKGGIGGIFFMALTLVLVSFSCTGPIVSSVLIKSTQQGDFWEPIITIFAFSVAFALPFTLLALFPSLLNKLPKSGGWLNSVKVVLGFVELALGLKFLSVADQTYGWGLLDREIYLALWIVIFSLLGVYLLGKIKFKHDSDVKSVSVGRLALAIGVFSFVVYMIPGMWGAPLKGLSGYLPPLQTQDFILTAGGGVTVAHGDVKTTASGQAKRYSDILHEMPHGLSANGYFHMEEAIEAAKAADKPIFIDFTGASCVNCREMEARVWSDPEVLSLLSNEFIIVALYGDVKKNALEDDWITRPNGNVLKGIGKINSYIAAERYGTNAMPTYIIADHEGNPLLPARGYNRSIPEYVQFLRRGIEAYKNLK